MVIKIIWGKLFINFIDVMKLFDKMLEIACSLRSKKVLKI